MSIGSLAAYPVSLALSLLPADMLATSVIGAIEGRSDARQLEEAMVVRLTNMEPPAMFAQEMVDTLPSADPNKLLSYQVSPYERMTAGAAGVIIASDGKDDYVLLGHKSLEKEPQGRWHLPAGFMNAAPSFNAQGIYAQNTPARGEMEKAIINGAKDAGIPAQYLDTTPAQYDRSLEEAAIREIAEETGLAIDKSRLVLASSDTHNINLNTAKGVIPNQSHTNSYLVDLRSENRLPNAKGRDDLESVKWVKLSDIEIRTNGNTKELWAEGAQVHPAYAVSIEKAVGKMHEQDLQALGTSREGVKPYMMEKTPTSEVGSEATAWHTRALETARVMKSTLEKHMADKSKPSSTLTR